MSPSSTSASSTPASPLPPISAEAPAFLRQSDPAFVLLVRRAARGSRRRRRKGVRVPLSRFGEDFLLAYAAIWYAVSHDVTLAFLPEPRKRV